MARAPQQPPPPPLLGQELAPARAARPPPIPPNVVRATPAPSRPPAAAAPRVPSSLQARPPAARPPSTELSSTEQVVRASPASLPRRLLASAVDMVIVGGVLAAYFWVATAVAGGKTPPTELTGLDGLMSTAHRLQGVLVPGALLGLLLALTYSATFARLWDGRTPGRVLAGIHLVDASGLPPAPARAVARALLSLVSGALFLGGFWLALFDRHGQTLHDKLTRTFIVRPG